ncbi:Homocysteine S-methyltransferase [Mycena haematopus]|nr:Homocysteine S-methyltransferase [Mycena haematopus]
MPNPLPLYPCTSSSLPTVKVLDGGLGTTLENTLDISHTPLWSAKAAIEHPEAVIDAHLAFLRAGAQMILTSTYQCSFSAFHKAGYSSQDAREIMSRCVRLASDAKARFGTERAGPEDPNTNIVNNVKIALSLGPFGASLSPAQEFDAYYPPPFGPRGYTPDSGNCNAFAPDAEGSRKESAATTALAQFHFERLCVFTDDAEAWDALDFIAFETVPLVREIRAVRMAMADLEEKISNNNMERKRKPWWISFVFPGGKFPETADSDGDAEARVPVRAVVAAAIQQEPASDVKPLPVPSALGINCTEVGAIPSILAEMEAAVLAEYCNSAAESRPRPWLALYPNAGDVYDPVSQTWAGKDKDKDKGAWAQELGALVAKIQSDSVWSGVVVGGCCRTGPADIGLLARRLRGQ